MLLKLDVQTSAEMPCNMEQKVKLVQTLPALFPDWQMSLLYPV